MPRANVLSLSIDQVLKDGRLPDVLSINSYALRDATIILDVAGEVCTEDSSYLRGRSMTSKNASVR